MWRLGVQTEFLVSLRFPGRTIYWRLLQFRSSWKLISRSLRCPTHLNLRQCLLSRPQGPGELIIHLVSNTQGKECASALRWFRISGESSRCERFTGQDRGQGPRTLVLTASLSPDGNILSVGDKRFRWRKCCSSPKRKHPQCLQQTSQSRMYCTSRVFFETSLQSNMKCDVYNLRELYAMSFFQVSCTVTMASYSDLKGSWKCCSSQVISQWESRHTIPERHKVQRFASAANCSPNEVLPSTNIFQQAFERMTKDMTASAPSTLKFMVVAPLDGRSPPLAPNAFHCAEVLCCSGVNRRVRCPQQDG